MEKNSTIITSSLLEGTNDYGQRIPDPTQASMAQVAEHLFDPMNANIYNAWSAGLINRVGMSIIENKRFENPLAEFRRNMLFGNTIQDIACKWGKAHSYKDDSEALLKYARPQFVTAFVSTDRFDTYEVSVTKNEIRQAIGEGEGSYALNSLISTAVTANCLNPEAYDEMNIMLQLFAAHQKEHGIFVHKLSAAPTDKATSQEMLAAVKKYANRLQFPSTLYNALDVDDLPTFARKDELVLLVTPDAMSNIDVYAYAELFNWQKAEVETRIIMVPELPFKGAQAILTTRDIFLCANSERGMYDFWDPSTLTTKSFYQVIGAYGINPFAPCILFSTDADATEVSTITETVASLNLTAASQTVAAGGTVQLTPALQGSITDNEAGIVVAPDSVTYTVAAHDSDGEAVALNTRTYVDRFNVLHVQKSIESGVIIDVTATATYTDPSATTTAAYTASVEITIA